VARGDKPVSGGSGNRQSEKPAGRAGLHSGHVFFLAALLVAPVIALVRLEGFGEPILVAAVASAISLVAFIAQWIDKRQAEAGAWRVPENALHLLELLGGWPGAFLAQRLFRHKTVKLSYRLVFWLIVAANEYAAIDYLLGWKGATGLRNALGL